MAGRIRSIKPEILEDAKTAGLDDHSWRLFVSLWMLADDYGCFHCHNERQVHGAVFWGNETTHEQTSEALARLSRESLVVLYTVRGQRYGKIANWEKHQRVDHPGKPRVPQPNDPEAVGITGGASAAAKPSRDSRETLAPDPDLRPPIPTPKGTNECGESGKPTTPAACVAMASYLLEAIRSHRPDHQARPQELAGWAREIDLALRRDSRTLEQLQGAIDWAHRSEHGTFWRPNLLSGKALRKHVARILIEMDRPKPPAPRGGARSGRPTPEDLGVEGLLLFADEWERQHGGGQ